MDRQGSLESALRRRQACVVVVGLCADAGHGGRAASACAQTAGASGVAVRRRPNRSIAGRTGSRFTSGLTRRRGSTHAKRAALIREWQVLVRRFIGAPWVVTIADPSSPLANFELDSLEPDAFASVATFDKVWVVRVARLGVGLGAGLHGSRVRHGHTAARAASASSSYPRCRMRLGPCFSSRATCSTRPR